MAICNNRNCSYARDRIEQNGLKVFCQGCKRMLPLGQISADLDAANAAYYGGHAAAAPNPAPTLPPSLSAAAESGEGKSSGSANSKAAPKPAPTLLSSTPSLFAAQSAVAERAGDQKFSGSEETKANRAGLVVAHRGRGVTNSRGHQKTYYPIGFTYPENAESSLAQALNEGADGVECDVCVSKDNVVMVIHDDPLFLNVYGATAADHLQLGHVFNHTAKELRTPKLFPIGPRLAPIPTLQEIIQMIARRADSYRAEHGRNIRLEIELKWHGIPLDVYLALGEPDKKELGDKPVHRAHLPPGLQSAADKKQSVRDVLVDAEAYKKKRDLECCGALAELLLASHQLKIDFVVHSFEFELVKMFKKIIGNRMPNVTTAVGIYSKHLTGTGKEIETNRRNATYRANALANLGKLLLDTETGRPFVNEIRPAWEDVVCLTSPYAETKELGHASKNTLLDFAREQRMAVTVWAWGESDPLSEGAVRARTFKALGHRQIESTLRSRAEARKKTVADAAKKTAMDAWLARQLPSENAAAATSADDKKRAERSAGKDAAAAAEADKAFLKLQARANLNNARAAQSLEFLVGKEFKQGNITEAVRAAHKSTKMTRRWCAHLLRLRQAYPEVQLNFLTDFPASIQQTLRTLSAFSDPQRNAWCESLRHSPGPQCIFGRKTCGRVAFQCDCDYGLETFLCAACEASARHLVCAHCNKHPSTPFVWPW